MVRGGELLLQDATARQLETLLKDTAVPAQIVVTAIGGQGHMAILKQLLATDQRLSAEDVRPYLD